MNHRTFVPASMIAALFATAALTTSVPALADDDAARAALPRSAVAIDDPVTLSFGRMLAHAPNTIAPAAPKSAGADPLFAAIVWQLHDLPGALGAAPAPQARAY